MGPNALERERRMLEEAQRQAASRARLTINQMQAFGIASSNGSAGGLRRPPATGASLGRPTLIVEDVLESPNLYQENIVSSGVPPLPPMPNLKERHLSADERRLFHRPKNDWKSTPAGDVCKNACTLPVEDILIKHKVMAT